MLIYGFIWSHRRSRMEKPYLITQRFYEDVVVLFLSGDLSYEHGTIDFRVRMREYIEEGFHDFIINFFEDKPGAKPWEKNVVESIDSSFIGELVHFTKVTRRFTLVKPRIKVRTALNATGLPKNFFKIAVRDPMMGRF